MATSGTTNFDLSIDRLVERAYARCGMNIRTGYELSAARDNLNLLFSEWGNRGVHLWKVSLYEQLLTSGTATYNTPSNCNDVLEAYISTGTGIGSSITDVSLTKIDRSAYAALPNKGSTGQPSQYYVDRQTNPKVTLYLTPDASTYTYLKYYYIKRIEDVGAFSNDPDVVYRFLPCMCSGLAYYLSIKRAPDRVEALRLFYEDELQRALTEDGQRTSVYISPQTYYGDGV